MLAKTEGRFATLKVTCELLTEICKPFRKDSRQDTSFFVRENGLPHDARAIEIETNNETRSIGVVLESEEFDVVPEGEEIPVLPPVILAVEYREAWEFEVEAKKQEEGEGK